MNRSMFLKGAMILLLGGLISMEVKAIDLTRIDLSHQYDPDAPIQLLHRVTQKGSNFVVHLEMTFDSTQQWSRGFSIQNGYQTEDHRDLTPTEHVLAETATSWTGSYAFQASERENLLVIRISGDFDFYFDISLRNGSLTYPSFFPIDGDWPITTSYLSTANPGWNQEQKMQVTRYLNTFGPADAPMEDMKALVPSMQEDTTFFMQDSVMFEDYRLYYFKNDTLADIGLAMFKVPPYYPRLRQIRELIQPLKYITTEAEYKTLLRSNRPKRTFDEFWINTYGTKFRARNSIRKYFKSVEYANQYFTTIKEGWKTDQGMIFIIFGTPYEVYRNDQGETWIYEGVEFEFVKVSTLFGPMYALRKDNRYEKDWYRQVGELRRGD